MILEEEVGQILLLCNAENRVGERYIGSTGRAVSSVMQLSASRDLLCKKKISFLHFTCSFTFRK